ncbi:hypothetical protein B0H66DRAFT_487208 [Apodospora peruviana]|uniref:protoporphyrinogen oxidase n=1 Tax=Apodospora peruviana TaxID=516989 RepID=A0AAE0IPL7_9PEZI|nr:hypothetical protein B0H66DRAFT_487208 [Apodospora peruviana]
MSVEVQLGTPLADALNMAIQGKIADLGWAGGGAEGAAMSEYFVLMLANGKTQNEIAAEISGDLLGLGPEDETAPAFAAWLFDQISTLSAQHPSAPAPEQNDANTAGDDPMDGGFDMDTMSDAPATEITAPTGPKAMRNGAAPRGREKRLVGQINRAMDRTNESVLHRVRGQSGNEGRIARTPPSGPRMGVGRQPRTTNIRAANVAQGLANMGGMPGGPPAMGGMNAMNGMNNMNGMNAGFMGPTPDIYAIMEQQNRMLAQMQQQLMAQNGMQMGQNGQHGHGKSLFERTSRPNNFQRGGRFQQHNGHQAQGQHHQAQQQQPQSGGAGQPEAAQQGEDTEMTQAKREPPNPDETICKYNLRCTNKECKFAHQSPAAPPNITIDVKDVCTYGVACKNRKCVGRHPSPATKVAHQSEQDCKFFPNCTNPHCPFKHPAMPPCRNGGECKVPNCKFTHLKMACKFRPCTNRFCAFSHEEGQRGTFHDKVWVANESGNKKPVSERKFVDESAPEELVLPGSEEHKPEASVPEVVLSCPTAYLSVFFALHPETCPLVTMYGTNLRCVARHSSSSSRSRRQALSLTTATTSTIRYKSTRTSNHDRQSQRTYTTTAVRRAPRQPSIGILGGGLTGLATAHFVTRYLPTAKVTLYEASDRLGGWVDTEEINVTTPDGTAGKVYFERGARMVKGAAPRSPSGWDALLFYDLVNTLKLADELRWSNLDAAAKGTYIYYPDHLVDLTIRFSGLLHRGQYLALIPHALDWIQKALTEPLVKDTIKSLSGMILRIPTKGPVPWVGADKDISLGHYIEYVTGSSAVVDNVVSAVIHGIYGGDVWKLSIFSSIMARRVRPRIKGDDGKNWLLATDLELAAAVKTDPPLPIADMLWFRNGFATLTDALAADLRKNPNVTIKVGDPVTSVRYHQKGAVGITTKKCKYTEDLHDKVLSTLFAGTLASLTQPKNLLPTLAKSEAVTIQIVNLWYPTPNLNHPASGFGYLIPQGVPYEQNPECALGVLFDSDREACFELNHPLPGDPSNQTSADTVPGTKFTVMLGGHYWDHLPKNQWPDHAQSIEMAKSVLARHLRIPQEETDKAVASTKLCRECIPQHYVGHRARMAAAEQELQAAFRGKLAVLGGSYQNPGVAPSLRAAWDIARQVTLEQGEELPKLTPDGVHVAEKIPKPFFPVGLTGLGRVAKPRQWAKSSAWPIYFLEDLYRSVRNRVEKIR